jgi:hypothetical protein
MIYAAQTKNKFPLVHTCQIKIEFFSFKRVEKCLGSKIAWISPNKSSGKFKLLQIYL